jgi:ABC-type Fe3+ transport system permease subunit
MNIALAGFVIILLLLPGLLFRKSYLSGEFSREYIVEDFFELLVNSLIPSFIFYLIIGLPLAWLFGYSYDFEHMLGLLSSDKDLLSKSLEKHRAL